jgi:carnitine O-acetyltransferase
MLQVQPDENVVPVIIPEKLPFNITEKLSKSITDSREALGAQVDDLDMACFTFQKYGKDFIKSCQLSPDSYIQMAIQAAFYRIHEIPGAQYESASTRMYKDGRTETIRSCSVESLEFSKALINNSLSAQDKFQAMKRAVEGHKRYAADAVQGYGIDRHLLGLKLTAKENKIKLPEFFQDPGLVKSSHFRISTSQVASVNQAFMCYGPLVPNGYGCCYNPRQNDISFGISAFNSSKETNAAQFKIALQQCLIDMQSIAAKSLSSKL